MVAGVHSYSLLTLSIPDPLTRTVADLVADEKASAAIGTMGLVMAILFVKEIDNNNRVLDDRFIPKRANIQRCLLEMKTRSQDVEFRSFISDAVACRWDILVQCSERYGIAHQ